LNVRSRWKQYDISVLAQGHQAHLRQKRLIRLLRSDILSMEKETLIHGFAFNHYFNHDEHLALRLDLGNRDIFHQLRGILNQLQNQLGFSPQLRQSRDWTSDNRIGESSEPVLRAYEVGSRFAFSAFEVQPDIWCSDPDMNLVCRYAASACHDVLRSLGVETSCQREIYLQLAVTLRSQIGGLRVPGVDLIESNPMVTQLTDAWYSCISKLLERERIHQDWLSDRMFLFHMCHGTMNSLGFSYQDEVRVYSSLSAILT